MWRTSSFARAMGEVDGTSVEEVGASKGVRRGSGKSSLSVNLAYASFHKRARSSSGSSCWIPRRRSSFVRRLSLRSRAARRGLFTSGHWTAGSLSARRLRGLPGVTGGCNAGGGEEVLGGGGDTLG